MRSSMGVLWDVDGTLVESTDLAFVATNEVLEANGFSQITVEQYKVGCKFTTPDRFNDHTGSPSGSEVGKQLGDEFDSTYVTRVSPDTAGLFPGIDRLLRSLALAGHPQANQLDEVPGERLSLFKVALGADEVPAAKPAGDGLILCCERLGVQPSSSVYIGDSPSDGKAARAAGMKSVGVLWGACAESALAGNFDVLVQDVPELIKALRQLLGEEGTL